LIWQVFFVGYIRPRNCLGVASALGQGVIVRHPFSGFPEDVDVGQAAELLDDLGRDVRQPPQ
jgi:hypothetical protein